MIVAGLILTFFVGFSLLNLISFRFSLLEKAGLSFLVGIASQTLLMLFMDGVGIGLTVTSVLTASVLLLIIPGIKMFRHRKSFSESLDVPSALPAGINLVWLLFIALIVYLEYMNWAKCIYFPTFDRDSLSGFDTIGWIISQEHTLKGLSVFQGDYISHINGPGSYITYMPMIQLSYAYLYALGAETSKLIPALIYLSFLVSFYAASRRFCGHTGAAIATFFVLITPEMIAFSSLSGTNAIHAVYASLGVIYTVLWLRGNERKDFVMAALLMAFNVWVRNEGVVFAAAAGIIVLAYKLKERNFKIIVLYLFISLLPLLLWGIFMKINGIYAEGIFIFKPFVDTQKMQVILHYFKTLLSASGYYGISFIAFGVAVVINILPIIKKKDLLSLLGITFLSLLFYMIVLYQIEYKWDSIENVLAYSAKRFLFCFIPLVWLYTLSNRYVVLMLGKLEKVLHINRL